MKVKIKAVKEQIPEGTEVEFESEFGRASGVWVGGNVRADTTYDVEFNIPEKLIWGDNVTPLSAIPDSDNHLWGRVEDVSDADITLRIGDSVLLIEVSSHAAKIDDLLSIRFSQILLYDQNF